MIPVYTVGPDEDPHEKAAQINDLRARFQHFETDDLIRELHARGKLGIMGHNVTVDGRVIRQSEEGLTEVQNRALAQATHEIIMALIAQPGIVRFESDKAGPDMPPESRVFTATLPVLL